MSSKFIYEKEYPDGRVARIVQRTMPTGTADEAWQFTGLWSKEEKEQFQQERNSWSPSKTAASPRSNSSTGNILASPRSNSSITGWFAADSDGTASPRSNSSIIGSFAADSDGTASQNPRNLEEATDELQVQGNPTRVLARPVSAPDFRRLLHGGSVPVAAVDPTIQLSPSHRQDHAEDADEEVSLLGFTSEQMNDAGEFDEEERALLLERCHAAEQNAEVWRRRFNLGAIGKEECEALPTGELERIYEEMESLRIDNDRLRRDNMLRQRHIERLECADRARASRAGTSFHEEEKHRSSFGSAEAFGQSDDETARNDQELDQELVAYLKQHMSLADQKLLLYRVDTIAILKIPSNLLALIAEYNREELQLFYKCLAVVPSQDDQRNLAFLYAQLEVLRKLFAHLYGKSLDRDIREQEDWFLAIIQQQQNEILALLRERLKEPETSDGSVSSLNITDDIIVSASSSSVQDSLLTNDAPDDDHELEDHGGWDPTSEHNDNSSDKKNEEEQHDDDEKSEGGWCPTTEHNGDSSVAERELPAQIITCALRKERETSGNDASLEADEANATERPSEAAKLRSKNSSIMNDASFASDEINDTDDNNDISFDNDKNHEKNEREDFGGNSFDHDSDSESSLIGGNGCDGIAHAIENATASNQRVQQDSGPMASVAVRRVAFASSEMEKKVRDMMTIRKNNPYICPLPACHKAVTDNANKSERSRLVRKHNAECHPGMINFQAVRKDRHVVQERFYNLVVQDPQCSKVQAAARHCLQPGTLLEIPTNPGSFDAFKRWLSRDTTYKSAKDALKMYAFTEEFHNGYDLQLFCAFWNSMGVNNQFLNGNRFTNESLSEYAKGLRDGTIYPNGGYALKVAGKNDDYPMAEADTVAEDSIEAHTALQRMSQEERVEDDDTKMSLFVSNESVTNGKTSIEGKPSSLSQEDVSSDVSSFSLDDVGDGCDSLSNLPMPFDDGLDDDEEEEDGNVNVLDKVIVFCKGEGPGIPSHCPACRSPITCVSGGKFDSSETETKMINKLQNHCEKHHAGKLYGTIVPGFRLEETGVRKLNDKLRREPEECKKLLRELLPRNGTLGSLEPLKETKKFRQWRRQNFHDVEEILKTRVIPEESRLKILLQLVLIYRAEKQEGPYYVFQVNYSKVVIERLIAEQNEALENDSSHHWKI